MKEILKAFWRACRALLFWVLHFISIPIVALFKAIAIGSQHCADEITAFVTPKA